MLLETTFQKKRTPSGSSPLVRLPVRGEQNIPGNMVQKYRSSKANPAAALRVPSATGKNLVTGWPVHRKKKPHPYTGSSVFTGSNQSFQPGKRRTVLSPGSPLIRYAPGSRKYIFSSAAAKALPGAAAPQRIRMAANNYYVPQPVSVAGSYPASVYRPEPAVVNPARQTSYACTGCGSKGSGCSTLSNFDTGSAQLTDIHLQQLAELSDSILGNGIRFITITGHTDTQDSDEDNLVLGNDRGIAVNRALRKALHQRKPWSQTAIFWKVKTKGESQLASDTDAGLNRRVMVCLHN